MGAPRGVVAAAVPRLRAARRALPRILLLIVVLLAPLWGGESAAGSNRLDRGLRWATRERAFNLAVWEVGALAGAVGARVAPPTTPGRDAAADRAIVERHVALSAEIERLNAERDRLAATGGAAAAASDVASRADELRAERASLAPRVEAIVAWQLERVLADEGIRRGWIDISHGAPSPRLSFNPAVVFHLGPTPDLLVVAPRDRIAVIGSTLLAPDLSFAEVDRIEARGDGLGYASLVTGIGGLAAYPAMIPASGSLRWTLDTVAHEWLHHYLAFRPLGASYFGDYEMRTLNETVADLAGRELGGLLHERFYAPPGETMPAASEEAAETSQQAESEEPATPSFGQLMRETRLEVERYLARGDVAGAERYMAEQQRELSSKGYYVRRLNTAYLSFFGAYAGSANPYEARLRELRERSGSLAAFLEAASLLTSPAELGP